MAENDFRFSQKQSIRFERNFLQSREMAVFRLILAIFGLNLAIFLKFQSYNFDAFEYAGAPLGVE